MLSSDPEQGDDAAGGGSKGVVFYFGGQRKEPGPRTKKPGEKGSPVEQEHEIRRS